MERYISGSSPSALTTPEPIEPIVTSLPIHFRFSHDHLREAFNCCLSPHLIFPLLFPSRPNREQIWIGTRHLRSLLSTQESWPHVRCTLDSTKAHGQSGEPIISLALFTNHFLPFSNPIHTPIWIRNRKWSEEVVEAVDRRDLGD